MPERIYRQPVWATDADGRTVVRVQLANKRGVAVIDAEDFERLRGDGMSDQWNFSRSGGGKGRVSTNWRYGKDCTSTVARAVLEADLEEIVRYRDGDPTNLRRGNLQCQTVRREWAQDPEYLATLNRIVTRDKGDGSDSLNRLNDRYGEMPYDEDDH